MITKSILKYTLSNRKDIMNVHIYLIPDTDQHLIPPMGGFYAGPGSLQGSCKQEEVQLMAESEFIIDPSVLQPHSCPHSMI